VPNWALLLVRLFLSLGASAFMTWVGWKLGGRAWALTAFVFSTPVIGVAIARPLVELTHEGFTWLAAQPLREWEGNYYAFGGVQIRVYDEDGALWFVTADVTKATGLPSLPRELAAGRVISGTRLKALSIGELEKLLLGHGGPEATRFLLWAQREVVTPWERKRSGALIPR
jgi:hypothetical protein